MKKPWKICVIHHSHTDIGYTDRQEKIEQYHVGFIRQALQILRDAASGQQPSWQGFKWTCETFWAVERFLEQATPQEQSDFAEAVVKGDIELSGTYLNMTELADEHLLRSMLGKAAAYGRSIGHVVDSAMTADINGYSWGYAQQLLDAGTKHLFSCVHTHHGMFPLGRKQTPFWWETRGGDQLLVWNGDHYMLGNELALCPDAVGKYMIRDEFDTPAIVDNQMEIAEIRIERYLAQLEEEGYPYDFVPVMISGLATDNGAPNGDLMAFIHEWNAKHGESVHIEMTTLSQFFATVKQTDIEIPVYRGDWPDWWSDGVNSTALHTQMFRDAQRTLRKIRQLDPNQEVITRQEMEAIEQPLIMYAEHTWGFHSSIYEPWHAQVTRLGIRKEAYASQGSTLAYRAWDKLMHSKGEALLYPNRPFRYRVLNTNSTLASGLAEMNLEGYEVVRFKDGLEVVDAATGSVVPHQKSGYQSYTVKVALEPLAHQEFYLRPVKHVESRTTTNNVQLIGADQVYDIADMYPGGGDQQGIKVSRHAIESDYVRIRWTDEGIVSWLNKETGEELLRTDRDHHAFTPVYEVTPAADAKDGGSQCAVRRQMGRNRKGLNAQRSIGRIVQMKEGIKGPLFATVELHYEVAGMSYYSVHLKVYADTNRVDVSVRLHKDSVWHPENLYIAMPFTLGRVGETLWLDKAGAPMCPGIDQLPGTCLDYYCIQEGLSLMNQQNGRQEALLVATPDTPLVQLGSLAHGTRLVHSQQTGDEPNHLYVWALSNYWETNFKATVGGFYEFHYRVQYDADCPTPEAAIDRVRSLASGFTVARVDR
ncbi:glycoside hydrolase family 38 N-terminal domain-containing protein [Paenibacillus guangzhouensis]|uniref:glycoside hydrolase family 38 N-terminal domain-containing protein n=1 Tax=Paenibacillus guangzhouensis TaxID=1473112 RepID=UPI001267071A|nr:glycoside hydrolase [Paenibacillus guangzhouensis]